MSVIRKLWLILNPDQRRAAVVLLCLMLIGMLMETLGIGMVIPALALMTQHDLAARYPALVPWLHRLGDPGPERLVIMGMLALVAVYLAKTLFLTFLGWRQVHFVYGVRAELSQRLFAGYLHQPYTFHLQRNSAQMIQNVIHETSLLATSGLIPGFTLITELLVFVGISALLLAVEPLGALLVISTLGMAGWGFSRFTRNGIKRWAEARQLHEGMRLQHLQQGLGGAKDVKLLGRESNFLEQYWLQNVGSARASEYEQTLQQLPRLFLELLAVIGLAALVMVIIAQGKTLQTLLPTLGVFAAAAFRMMPSTNRFLLAIQSTRYTMPVVNVLHDELCMFGQSAAPQVCPPMHFGKILLLDKVSFTYPASERPALCEISMSIFHGTSVGIIGGSGAGKSTLVDIILGLYSPDHGVIRIDGMDIRSNLRGWQNLIGYVPQSIFLTDDTIRCNIAFGVPAEQIDDAAVWRAICAAQLEPLLKQLPKGLDTVVGERGVRLSGGQRQRIGIARALYHNPEVMVLDEATSSLDIATEHEVMGAVSALRGSKTLIIVAHRLSTVGNCDYLYRMEQGKIVEEGSASVVLGKMSHLMV